MASIPRGAASPGSSGGASASASAPPPPPPPPPKPEPTDAEVRERMESMGFTPPPIKEQAAMAEEGDMNKLPPPVRSIMLMTNTFINTFAHRAGFAPGFQASIMFEGRPYIYSTGYRDGKRGRDPEDKGNHLRNRDPLLLGQLTVPLTALLCLQLHDARSIDLEAPLTAYLPELPDTYDRLNARDVLARRAVVDDAGIYAAAGASPIPFYFLGDRVAAYEARVSAPLRAYFGEASGSAPEQTRRHLCEFLRSSKSVAAPRRLHNSRRIVRAPLSHFSVALLAAAVERQLGKTYEELMAKHIFEELQARAAGFGPPKQYRDPGDMFFIPRGLACGHRTFAAPVPLGDAANAAPSIFNASLNCHIPAEVSGSVIMTAVDTIKNAAAKLKGTPNERLAYWELGLLHNPHRRHMSLPTRWWASGYAPSLPYSSALFYDCTNDLGGHAILNCGNRRANVCANIIPKAQNMLFVTQIIRKGAQIHASDDQLSDRAKKVEEDVLKQQERNDELNKKYNPYARRTFERY